MDMLRCTPLLLILVLFGCATPTAHPPAQSLEINIHKNFQYATRNGGALTGDIYAPGGPGPFPAVLLIHGGGWSGGYRSTMNGIARRLAQHGFVAFNISYSFSPRYTFPVQVNESQDAILWMRKNAQELKIDPTRIAAWGYSAGAQIAALLGTRSDSHRTDAANIQAVIAGSGPYNLVNYTDDPVAIQYIGAGQEKSKKAFRDASPVLHVSPSTPPMFLYHGTADRTVQLENTVAMKSALDDKGITNEMYLIDGLGHIPMFLFGRSAERGAIIFLKSQFKID